MLQRLAAIGFACVTLLAGSSCAFTTPCDDVSPVVYLEPMVLEFWVGDSYPVRATLYDIGCEKVIASSQDTPSGFSFTSSDAAVVSIAADGTLKAIAPGKATIEAKAGLHTGGTVALVTLPIASVRIVTPATVVAGTTIRAQVEALDAAGDAIPNARVWGFSVTGPTNRSITYEVVNPSEYRFDVASSGVYTLSAEFRRTPTTRVVKTVTITVP